MKTVVVLFSDKRSGSTMLQQSICSHPKVQTVKYSPHTYLETHHWLKAAVLLGLEPKLFSNGKMYNNYGSKQNARIYLESEILGNIANFQIPKDNKKLIFEGWDALCDKFAQPVFFEKSPQHLAHWAAVSLFLEWAQKTKKYNVKIIGLVRNPLSVLYSAFKLFRSKPYKRQFSWLNIQKNLLVLDSILNKNQFQIYRYEDIIDNPEKKLNEICDFIDIEHDKIMINKIHGKSIK